MHYVPVMTDTAINPTTNIDRDARIDLLAETVDRLSNGLAAFTSAATSLLSGQPGQAPVRRRGRPPKGSSLQATSKQAEKAALHPFQLQCVALIERNGRMTQTELADAVRGDKGLNETRPMVEYHMAGKKNANNAVRRGAAVKVVTFPGGVETVTYFSPKHISFRNGK